MATAAAPAQVADLVVFSTQEIKVRGGIKFMVHSAPHKGKTDLIRTLPKPLVFAAENGLLTLQKYNIPYVPLNTIDALTHATKWVRAKMYRGKYESMCLDSVSYLSTLILSELRSDPAKYTNNGQKHYGMMRDMVSEFLQALFESELHVYVTAWATETLDAFGRASILPFTEGKALQSYLVHYFDLTAHLEWHSVDVPQADGTTQKQQLPYLQTVEANGIFARCRKQGALAAFETPNLTDIINKLLD